MLRTRLTFAAASAAIALLATLSIARADDVGDKLAPVGEAIKNGAENTGTAISNAAKEAGQKIQEGGQPVADSVKKTAQDVGPTVQEKAQETGSYLDTATKSFRDGASNFFQKVSNFFNGK